MNLDGALVAQQTPPWADAVQTGASQEVGPDHPTGVPSCNPGAEWHQAKWGRGSWACPVSEDKQLQRWD